MASEAKSPERIRQEIADLTRRRDVMLRNAPKHVLASRLIMPIILVPVLLGLGARPAHGAPLASVLILLVISAALAAGCWKLWRPGYDPRDLWAASDRVGYEGESPRQVQRRIDALQTKLPPEAGGE